MLSPASTHGNPVEHCCENKIVLEIKIHPHSIEMALPWDCICYGCLMLPMAPPWHSPMSSVTSVNQSHSYQSLRTSPALRGLTPCPWRWSAKQPRSLLYFVSQEHSYLHTFVVPCSQPRPQPFPDPPFLIISPASSVVFVYKVMYLLVWFDSLIINLGQLLPNFCCLFPSLSPHARLGA